MFEIEPKNVSENFEKNFDRKFFFGQKNFFFGRKFFFLDLDSRYLYRPLTIHKTIFLTDDPVKLDFFTIRVLSINQDFLSRSE